MATRFCIGGGLHEDDRVVLARVAAAFGVTVSDFIAWAVDQAIDPGLAEIVTARDFKLPRKPLCKPTCKSPGCTDAQHARGLCPRHYEHAYRTNEWVPA